MILPYGKNRSSSVGRLTFRKCFSPSSLRIRAIKRIVLPDFGSMSSTRKSRVSSPLWKNRSSSARAEVKSPLEYEVTAAWSSQADRKSEHAVLIAMTPRE
jgi:hypothetical protein